MATAVATLSRVNMYGSIICLFFRFGKSPRVKNKTDFSSVLETKKCLFRKYYIAKYSSDCITSGEPFDFTWKPAANRDASSSSLATRSTVRWGKTSWKLLSTSSSKQKGASSCDAFLTCVCVCVCVSLPNS